MKTKNNLTTGIIIGICVIVLPLILMSSSPSSPNNGVVYSTPESHIWSFGSDGSDCYIYNKVTGDVRILSGGVPTKGNYQTLNEGK